jgi:hypothetical protein
MMFCHVSALLARYSKDSTRQHQQLLQLGRQTASPYFCQLLLQHLLICLAVWLQLQPHVIQLCLQCSRQPGTTIALRRLVTCTWDSKAHEQNEGSFSMHTGTCTPCGVLKAGLTCMMMGPKMSIFIHVICRPTAKV